MLVATLLLGVLSGAMSAAITTPSHASDGAAAPHPHPVPPPVPGRPYEQVGSIDVLTMESTIFWWKNKTYVLENIGCGYADHAGKWFPEFKGHSYARVRDFSTGVVVDNISSSIGFGFLNAFPDYDHNRLWLFGTPADRCHGNCGACSGASCPGRPSCLAAAAAAGVVYRRRKLQVIRSTRPTGADAMVITNAAYDVSDAYVVSAAPAVPAAASPAPTLGLAPTLPDDRPEPDVVTDTPEAAAVPPASAGRRIRGSVIVGENTTECDTVNLLRHLDTYEI